MEEHSWFFFWAVMAMGGGMFVWKWFDEQTGGETQDRFMDRWGKWWVWIFVGLFILFLITGDRGPRDPDLLPGM
jgi:hypothetical protein